MVPNPSDGVWVKLERKIIGYSQSRKGPNEILIIGITQPKYTYTTMSL